MNKEDLRNIKYYIGPMSKNIVDTILDISEKEKYKFGIIPSRRQIDYNGGYVNNWNTKSFFEYVKDKRHLAIFERDHGGINQGSENDDGILSFKTDANLFDIIHIDPWKASYSSAINELIDNIKFINNINPSVLYEIGTEESIYHFDCSDIENMLEYLSKELDDELFNKIVYCVIQSGTKISGIKNIGNFDKIRLKKMIKICNKYNILSKEHNGDYLTQDEIKKRFDIGLSAINIAPEFGVYETDILLEYMNDEQKLNFFNICFNSNKWVKWVNNKFNPLTNKNELMKICGHYQFSNPKFIDMHINCDIEIKEKIYEKLKKLYEI
ncbi:hypothetical protein M0Q97_01640 [Candidatus Dojkabacteria bacterium]|jgi:hypothetical protein|nr:hypothetical protein [Candidatus Dojkabacteria bacterium]